MNIFQTEPKSKSPEQTQILQINYVPKEKDVDTYLGNLFKFIKNPKKNIPQLKNLNELNENGKMEDENLQIKFPKKYTDKYINIFYKQKHKPSYLIKRRNKRNLEADSEIKEKSKIILPKIKSSSDYSKISNNISTINDNKELSTRRMNVIPESNVDKCIPEAEVLELCKIKNCINNNRYNISVNKNLSNKIFENLINEHSLERKQQIYKLLKTKYKSEINLNFNGGIGRNIQNDNNSEFKIYNDVLYLKEKSDILNKNKGNFQNKIIFNKYLCINKQNYGPLIKLDPNISENKKVNNIPSFILQQKNIKKSLFQMKNDVNKLQVSANSSVKEANKLIENIGVFLKEKHLKNSEKLKISGTYKIILENPSDFYYNPKHY